MDGELTVEEDIEEEEQGGVVEVAAAMVIPGVRDFTSESRLAGKWVKVLGTNLLNTTVLRHQESICLLLKQNPCNSQSKQRDRPCCIYAPIWESVSTASGVWTKPVSSPQYSLVYSDCQ